MPAYLPKTVMITGATGGFGLAFAHKFAAAGCRLILTSRKPGKLGELAAELKVPLHKIVLDMRDRKAIEKAFADLPPDFRELDLLINNAGGAFGQDKAWEASLDDWQEMIEINDLGLVTATRLALPGMVERKNGHIVNIGSVSGNYAYPGGHVYCAAKAFVRQFSSALRADLLGTGVRVTNIEPGMVETPFSLNRYRGDAERAAKIYQGADALTADDIAEAVFWAATQPPRVNIERIELMPQTQALAGLAVKRR
ncbi:MAG TPA: SDR family NAD(P)-dependent oxidoreductase [Alphaproteobacteria bacterium]|nr:SDR family NAD(P)-dependent oxidoreductase [Alphaproteobacteria bacterium]